MNLRKKIATVAILAGVAGASATAAAYWTESGTGSGTADTGATVGVDVNQNDFAADALFPGGDPITLSGTFDNSNDGPVKVGSVTHSISSIVPAQANPDKPACVVGDFALGGTAPVNAQIAKGDGVGNWSGLTIQLKNDPAKNQDNCKSVSVNLAYEVSAAA